ncbi:hypothetical protein Tcan_12777 [Toxocara canis]|uniref:Uncharacterized protein n=1 Tax=Toxocara canis TaxID=6265 RepID=A0A0B2USN8_TOXCA|nr:hypothetical protein Tcan_12777 [Toxocara canis]
MGRTAATSMRRCMDAASSGSRQMEKLPAASMERTMKSMKSQLFKVFKAEGIVRHARSCVGMRPLYGTVSVGAFRETGRIRYNIKLLREWNSRAAIAASLANVSMQSIINYSTGFTLSTKHFA